MKMHHLGILFIALVVTIFLMLDMKMSNLKLIMDENTKLDLCLDGAIDDGVNTFAKSDTKRQLISSKDDAVSSFLTSLYSSLNIVSDPVAQQKLRIYLPVICITETDGMYILYHDEYQIDGITNTSMRWSEKYSYSYEDADFIYSFTMNDIVHIYDKKHLITDSMENPFMELDYHDFQKEDEFELFRYEHPDHFLLHDEKFYTVRKQTMINVVNKKMSVYVNEHNVIAAKSGICYIFSLPVIDESELLRSVEQPGMIAVFQGYPIQNTGETYNRVAIAGAQIYKEDEYYIEEKGWYKVYHKSTCHQCETNPQIDKSVVYDTVSDCVAKGAYACEECCPQGVHVPEYHMK